MSRSFHLHLISDATGETAIAIARAACAQFDGAKCIEHLWSLVRTEAQLTRVLNNIEANPGVVFYSVVDAELRNMLELSCRKANIPSVSLLDSAIKTLSIYLGEESVNQPGGQHVMDADYLKRIDAMNFALAHDDGQGTLTMSGADVVLVGVSRTSKTPTCFYLANRGLKAANVPFVHGCPLPKELLNLKGPLIVGLTRGADQLVDIRKNRLAHLGEKQETDYVNPETVDNEVKEARRLFRKRNWAVLDVSRRSIEETAAAVLQLYDKQGQ
tara:strand:+ start:103298 stop:104110 length:813 start_codon:yes stop_codon:yes gene_type:complete